ncbi:hypothetical protein [Sphingomonas sp. OTU376]|uniref:hypothetical protein n=1 Tax=Sphingomonas sp. OTU376 TaxID=3043863 RepID=UPI00313B581D
MTDIDSRDISVELREAANLLEGSGDLDLRDACRDAASRLATTPTRSQSVLQPWVVALPFMQQSVLIAAVRAPDGLRKDHPIKVIMRWYRRCVLFGAFERNVFATPFCPGGGSFTGPFTPEHAQQYCGSVGSGFYWRGNVVPGDPQEQFDHMREVYLRHVDEMPHHFQLHLMHAAQIIGYKHNDPAVREWWATFYRMIVNDAHLFPESEELMDMRLGDTEAGWRAREEVTAP